MFMLKKLCSYLINKYCTFHCIFPSQGYACPWSPPALPYVSLSVLDCSLPCPVTVAMLSVAGWHAALLPPCQGSPQPNQPWVELWWDEILYAVVGRPTRKLYIWYHNIVSNELQTGWIFRTSVKMWLPHSFTALKGEPQQSIPGASWNTLRFSQQDEPSATIQ